MESTESGRRLAWTRRELGRLALAGVGALVAGPLVTRRAAAEGEGLVTDHPENAAMVAALQYVNESAKADQRCANCVFYTAGDDDRGRCALFQKGLVPAAGWCTSWNAKG